MDNLVEMVRHADELIIHDLIHALALRFGELSPEYELLFFSVEKKRNFDEQADEIIALMQDLKEMKPEKE